jgi:hypothetical protein
MRFRIRTFQLFVIAATGPIWALAAGATTGCLGQVFVIWTILVFIPLGAAALASRWIKSESLRERAVALFVAMAIVGYFISVFASPMVIDIHMPSWP